MYLQRPDLESPSSRIADWLELLAASRPTQAFGGGDIQKMVRVESEERVTRRSRDEETGELEEGEITAREGADLSREVFTELRRRAALLRGDYPFVVEDVEGMVTPRSRIRRREEDTSGALIYLYCLIISALRLTLVGLNGSDKDLKIGGNLFYSEYQFGSLLQICASLALGGYLRGKVVSFGYPRPDGSTFLGANKAVWGSFGAYTPVSAVPVGAPNQENDAGIDLIGWINFPDGNGSKVLVFGQVASGRNWTGKSAMDCAHALKTWFASPTYTHFIPAMVMPFNITDARKSIERGTGEDLRRAIFEIEERQFGIVLDRDRIAVSAAKALQFSADEKAEIDGVNQVALVENWVKAALGHLRAAA